MDGSHVFLSWWIVLVLGIVWLPHDMCVHVYGVCVCVCVCVCMYVLWVMCHFVVCTYFVVELELVAFICATGGWVYHLLGHCFPMNIITVARGVW